MANTYILRKEVSELSDLKGVTAVYQDLNALDGAANGAAGFTLGAEAVETRNVAVQMNKADGNPATMRHTVFAYLSDDAQGDDLTATAPDGGVAIGTNGVLIPVGPTISNALVVDGNLAISATAEKFKTTQTAAYFVNGVSHVKAATDDLVFTAAHVITASKFGIIRVQINAAGTISTKVPASPQAYDSAPLALAALPAVDAGNVSLGYIAIENNAGDWTANTDDLTNASDLTTAAFTDSTEATVGTAKAWHLVANDTGDVDINIVHSGVHSWYLCIVHPSGKQSNSAVIAFA